MRLSTVNTWCSLDHHGTFRQSPSYRIAVPMPTLFLFPPWFVPSVTTVLLLLRRMGLKNPAIIGCENNIIVRPTQGMWGMDMYLILLPHVEGQINKSTYRWHVQHPCTQTPAVGVIRGEGHGCRYFTYYTCCSQCIVPTTEPDSYWPSCTDLVSGFQHEAGNKK